MKPIIPSELLCALCKDLLSDAVLIPCCGDSFCDDCKLSNFRILPVGFIIFLLLYQVFAPYFSSQRTKSVHSVTLKTSLLIPWSQIDFCERLLPISVVRRATLKRFLNQLIKPPYQSQNRQLYHPLRSLNRSHPLRMRIQMTKRSLNWSWR